MSFKAQLYEACKQQLLDRMNLFKKLLDDLKESGMNESKRTAGDKHETGLAMIQIEQENNRRQLQDATLQYDRFCRIDINASPGRVAVGSLITTDKAVFFIGLSLGKIKIAEITVQVISPQSPLGMKLLGLQPGDSVVMNNSSYSIQKIE